MQAPFEFETIPVGQDTTELKNPELTIEPRKIVVALGAAKLSLKLLDNAVLSLHTGNWHSEQQSLSTVAAHQDAGQGLRRFEFIDAPYHSAIHIVDDAAKTNPNYCTMHSHDDVAELNVIVPMSHGLDYRVTDGASDRHVREPAIFWFEPGEPHCATATIGSGLFFVARIPSEFCPV